jgi:hypothetical protein
MKRPQTAITDRHDWDARATEALDAARKLPNGPKRAEAMKKAGQLRIAADIKGILFAPLGRPPKR